MVKNRVLFCNNSLGRNAWRYLVPFYDVILPIDHVSMILDGVTSFLRVINIRNTCKCLRYSQTFSRFSSMQWLKVGRICRILKFLDFVFIDECLLSTQHTWVLNKRKSRSPSNPHAAGWYIQTQVSAFRRMNHIFENFLDMIIRTWT